jgi:hypothetical protein
VHESQVAEASGVLTYSSNTPRARVPPTGQVSDALASPALVLAAADALSTAWPVLEDRIVVGDGVALASPNLTWHPVRLAGGQNTVTSTSPPARLTNEGSSVDACAVYVKLNVAISAEMLDTEP